MESGSSTQQLQLHKETKKDFFIPWCWQSEPPLWLHLGEECVKCEQNKWSVCRQHGRHLCSTSLLPGCQASWLDKSKPNYSRPWARSSEVAVGKMHLCVPGRSFFSAVQIMCSLYLDKSRPGFAHCWAAALLKRSHFVKEKGAAPSLFLSCCLSPGVWENQKASPQS